MPTLDDPDIREFLLHGTRTGKVGVLAADGRPIVAPVWFTVDGDHLAFTCGSHTAKAKAIARDNRVVVCVDLQEPPYAYVQVQGLADTTDDPAELLRIATAVGGRYMGADRAEEFGKRNSPPGEIVVRVRPTRIVADLNVTA